MEITVDVNSQERTVVTMRRDEVGIMNDGSVVFRRKDIAQGDNDHVCDVWVIFRKYGEIEVYKQNHTYPPDSIAGQHVKLFPLGTTITIKL